MAQIINLLTLYFWTILPLALLLFCGTVFIMRRRLVHIAEPAVLQGFVLCFGFAGFYIVYEPNDYSWWAVVLGSVLGIAPFVLFYRRSFATDPAILEKRDHLAKSTDFRIFLVASCAAIIAESLITIVGSGLIVGPKNQAALLIRQGGVLAYFSQAAVSFVPAFLLLTYGTYLFYLVTAAGVTYLLAATFAASRMSFLWPAMAIGAAFFLHKLDRNTAEGWPATTIISFKNFFVGITGIAAAFGLLALAGALLTGSASAFVMAFVFRLFQSFDGPFLAILFSFINPHAPHEYSVWLTYTQPIHKLLHLEVGQLYSNVGEYVAVNVYHFNIWSNPNLALLALPNSNLVLEFELSYNLVTALVLISLYATAIVSLMNWSERRRYNSLGFFCISQLLIMNALQFFSDGAYFVVTAYATAALLVLAKVGGTLGDVLLDSLKRGEEPGGGGKEHRSSRTI